MSLSFSQLCAEGNYEAAKWLKIPALLDAAEMAELFEHLGDFHLYPLGSLSSVEEIPLSRTAFVDAVGSWNEQLQSGRAPALGSTKPFLASAMSVDPECLWLQEVKERVLVKIRRPVVQLAAHFFTFAKEEKSFHSMVFGKESIFWGIQFSYPQIFLDPSTQDFCKVDDAFVNTALFHKIRRWVRDFTRSVPFLCADEKINASFRIGKRCLPWIAQHPQLASSGLKVAYEN